MPYREPFSGAGFMFRFVEVAVERAQQLGKGFALKQIQ
jgi:hypothetical protein